VGGFVGSGVEIGLTGEGDLVAGGVRAGAHLAARIGSGAVDVGLNPRDIVRAEGGLDLVAVGQRGPGASDAALSGSVDTGRCAASGILLRLAL
jgi:hypothetical protein